MNLFSTHVNPNESVQWLAPVEVRKKVLHNLGLISMSVPENGEEKHLTTSTSVQTICAEALRAGLWSLSNEGTKPVYISRLVSIVHRLVEPGLTGNVLIADEHLKYFASSESTTNPQHIKKDIISKLLHRALDELELLGDVVSLPHGYWLPAPLHFVSLPAIRRWILVGGRPANSFPKSLHSAIEYSGPTRFLIHNPVELGFQDVVQSEEQWYRIPQESIDVWARHILFNTKLQPIEALGTSCEFYAPNARGVSGKPQYFRWIDDARSLVDGRYLIRFKLKGFTSHYAIAEIQQGKITATGSIELGEGDVRRLLYGIDAFVSYPIKIQITKKADSWLFPLNSELPKAEHRLFTALGYLHLPSDGRYYPRTWEIPAEYAIQAVQALQRLYIRLEGINELLSKQSGEREEVPKGIG